MANKNNIHVVKTDTGWVGKREGALRASVTGPTQKDVIQKAMKLSPDELLIHGRDNLIRDRRTYGTDPFPPRG